MKLSNIALRNITRNSRRSVLSIVAIAVAAMSITLLFSFLAGMKSDLRYNLQTYYTGAIRVRNSEYNRYEQLHPMHLAVDNASQLADQLAALSGVQAVSPRLQFPGMVFKGEEDYTLAGMGVDFDRESAYENLPEHLAAGRIPQEGSREALLGVGLAQKIGLSVGDTLTVLSTTRYRGSNAMTFTVSGLVSFPVGGMNDTYMLIPLSVAQYFLRMGNAVTEILLKTDPGADLDAVTRSVEKSVTSASQAPLVAQNWTEIKTSYSFYEMANTTYMFIALFFFILGSTVIVNTTMMVIYERMKEIGTLAALGMTGGQLVRLFFTESLFLSLAGAFAGVVAGIAITLPLASVGINFSNSMQGVSMEISNVLYPRLNLRSTVFVFFYAVAVASLTSLIPSRRVSRINPVEALRSI